jgi:hypothetical protein
VDAIDTDKIIAERKLAAAIPALEVSSTSNLCVVVGGVL